MPDTNYKLELHHTFERDELMTSHEHQSVETTRAIQRLVRTRARATCAPPIRSPDLSASTLAVCDTKGSERAGPGPQHQTSRCLIREANLCQQPWLLSNAE